MNEYTVLYQAVGALIGCVAACLLYSLGGRSGKWKRRFVASAILTATVNVVCLLRGIWSPLMLVIFPILALGFSLGYGGELPMQKFIKRFFYASAVVMAGFLMAFILKGNAWFVLIPHAGIAMWSIYLGLKNPIEAAAEEVFVCLFLNVGLMMYPFIGR